VAIVFRATPLATRREKPSTEAGAQHAAGAWG